MLQLLATDQEVEVTVSAGLPTEQCIDAPAAGDGSHYAVHQEHVEHGHHILRPHVRDELLAADRCRPDRLLKQAIQQQPAASRRAPIDDLSLTAGRV